MRTEPLQGAHMQPVWEVSATLREPPQNIELEVWDKNRWHKDVFCGATQPIKFHPNMGMIHEKAYKLEKHNKETGAIDRGHLILPAIHNYVECTEAIFNQAGWPD